ncbi:bifunctional 4-hydroxy-2-oxoglutarate aldolase/2-dehydro-3-deoxy-phosphogluconate aldolase [Agromyces aureus]|uniref:2-dehydro-3-deoxyphosphogluconate aldolase n=1 Tax=Agromyces aureus TaxID=453304 RepID=A0A191WHV9_9MICO|nr:bifunctional 4-hydroxy-2-oxoglutarate aldolase/2-dehydro-3-deoxy-phosphogluconate aldolase [Agromyces aureus]ANJ27807.1 2-dehydro-3-deoxyphosphogluconate aldolase [Agromyces aureus]
MNDSFDVLLGRSPVMAILRGMGAEKTLEISKLAWALGVDCVEVPLQTDRDHDTLTALARAAASAGRAVGAGTILDERGVAAAVAAGARFTVSPGWDPEVARASLDAGLPHLPGVGSASDVHHARKFGLRWVKAFPAAQLGPDWITAMKAPFPDMSFVATGGITIENAEAFLEAGASAVAIGSALADTERAADLLRSTARFTA